MAQSQPNDPQPAASRPISLSQAVLAPLDAVFKAQIHAARSFLNMLWQIAYPHLPVDEQGELIEPVDENLKKPYSFPVSFETIDENGTRTTTVSIPSISLVPITPLGVEEATIRFAMSVTNIADHEQLQPVEKKKYKNTAHEEFDDKKRPWFLVECPVSLRGNVVAHGSSDTSIEITIKLAKSPIPAALEKTLTVLTQNITTKHS